MELVQQKTSGILESVACRAQARVFPGVQRAKKECVMIFNFYLSEERGSIRIYLKLLRQHQSLEGRLLLISFRIKSAPAATSFAASWSPSAVASFSVCTAALDVAFHALGAVEADDDRPHAQDRALRTLDPVCFDPIGTLQPPSVACA